MIGCTLSLSFDYKNYNNRIVNIEVRFGEIIELLEIPPLISFIILSFPIFIDSIYLNFTQ